MDKLEKDRRNIPSGEKFYSMSHRREVLQMQDLRCQICSSEGSALPSGEASTLALAIRVSCVKFPFAKRAQCGITLNQPTRAGCSNALYATRNTDTSRHWFPYKQMLHAA